MPVKKTSVKKTTPAKGSAFVIYYSSDEALITTLEGERKLLRDWFNKSTRNVGRDRADYDRTVVPSEDGVQVSLRAWIRIEGE